MAELNEMFTCFVRNPLVTRTCITRVQDTDGSYFESFTALSWRQENRRLAALRLAEARAERPPPAPHDQSKSVYQV